MRIFNLFKSNAKSNEIGKVISWKESINIVFKIIDFDNNGTVIDVNGNVKAKSSFKPYGYLTVTNPNVSENYQLPIIHKDDYFLIEQFFSNPQYRKVVDEKEILVVYRPENITKSGAAGITHCLHFVITSQNTINEFYKKYGHSPNEKVIAKLFVSYSWSMIKVEVNDNPLI